MLFFHVWCCKISFGSDILLASIQGHYIINFSLRPNFWLIELTIFIINWFSRISRNWIQKCTIGRDVWVKKLHNNDNSRLQTADHLIKLSFLIILGWMISVVLLETLYLNKLIWKKMLHITLWCEYIFCDGIYCLLITSSYSINNRSLIFLQFRNLLYIHWYVFSLLDILIDDFNLSTFYVRTSKIIII